MPLDSGVAGETEICDDSKSMNKSTLISTITEYLSDELKSGASSEREKEIKSILLMYRFLPVRTYGPEDVIVPSALVELKLGQAHAHYFIAPQGGGLITSVEGKAVQVITPQSPLGEALMGKKVGDTVKVDSRGSVREYQVVAIS